MSDELHDIFKGIKQEALTDRERALLRNSLQLAMAEHPAEAPLRIRMLDAIEAFAVGGPSFRAVGVAFALVLVLGSGTVFAAQSALPGDPLYAMKVNFNEKLPEVLATEEVKVALATERVERRLEEAELLAVQGRLTPEKQAVIEAQLHKSTNEFHARLAVLAEHEDGETKVADAQSDLEASLEAHERVLASMSLNVPRVRDTVGSLLATVKTQAAVTRVARAELEDSIARKNTNRTRTVAVEKKSDATVALNQVRATVSQAEDRGSVSRDTRDGAAENTLRVEAAINEGEDRLRDGEFGDAFRTFQEAIRTAKATTLGIEAEARFGTTVAPAVPGATTSATSTATTTTATSTDETEDID